MNEIIKSNQGMETQHEVCLLVCLFVCLFVFKKTQSEIMLEMKISENNFKISVENLTNSQK